MFPHSRTPDRSDSQRSLSGDTPRRERRSTTGYGRPRVLTAPRKTPHSAQASMRRSPGKYRAQGSARLRADQSGLCACEGLLGVSSTGWPRLGGRRLENGLGFGGELQNLEPERIPAAYVWI